MEVVELQPVLDVGDSHARHAMPERSTHAGVHVSDIIRYIEHTVTNKGNRPRKEDLLPEERKYLALYASMGWAWELLITPALMQVWSAERDGDPDFLRPGEMELDGIVGNPDGFSINGMRIYEFKATYRSSRRPIETDFWSWMVQVKAYCYLLAVNEVEFHVFFVNGNYKPIKPSMRRFYLSFTDDEVEENWAMLLKNRDAARNAARGRESDGNAT